MEETTLTYKNLITIHQSMKRIKKIDRSNYFDQYFKEVEQKIDKIQELQIIQALAINNTKIKKSCQ